VLERAERGESWDRRASRLLSVVLLTGLTMGSLAVVLAVVVWLWRVLL
jgi:hypothetical protein